MKNKLSKLILATVFASVTYTSSAIATSSFQTDEYYNFDKNFFRGTSALDLINAASAYEKGYTGKDIIVGISDSGSVNFQHIDFINKPNNKYVGDNDKVVSHSTLVAGIVAANKDDLGMHGVAFNASVWSTSLFDLKGYETINADDSVKIINQSWSSDYSIDKANDYNFINEVLKDEWLAIPKPAIKTAIQKDKLIITTPGNYGEISPYLYAGMDSIKYLADEYTSNSSFITNIINVMAANSSDWEKDSANNLELSFKDNAGNNSNSTGGIAIFTNLSAYNEDNSIIAPGTMVYTSNADYNLPGETPWLYQNGTSVAAPIVSGIAALVQEAHPYLTGKQIGDVLLSTATKPINLENKQENSYFILFGDYSEGSQDVNIFYFGDVPTDKTQIREDVAQFIIDHPDEWKVPYHPYEDIVPVELMQEVINNGKITALGNVHQSLYLGQGMVNADAAINGLGAINVHRLGKNDAKTDYSLTKADGPQEKFAYYSVNTHGFDAEWSNNISEIRAGYIAANPLVNGSTEVCDLDFAGKDADLKDLHDRWVFYTDPKNKEYNSWLFDTHLNDYNDRVEASGLAGLSAGLIKEGAGCLTLSGENTYKGTTVVTSGVLNITGSVAGDAWSAKNGVLAGNGTINASVMNNGTMMAGDYRAQAVDEDKDSAKMQTFDVKDKNLTINGSLTGEGTILINGNADSIIEVGETADISKMQIKSAEMIDLEAAKAGVTFLTANNVQTQDDQTVSNQAGKLSYLLNYEVQVTDTTSNKEAQITVSQNEDAPLDDGFKDLVTSLYNWDATDMEMTKFNSRFFALQEKEIQATIAEQTNSIYADMAHEALRNRTVRTTINARALGSVAQDGENAKWWATMGKNWHRFGSANAHSFSIATGLDFIHDEKAYAGAMLSFSDNSISNKNASGKYKEYGVALYAGTQNMPAKLSGYVSATRQNNEVKRNFSVMNLTAESDYHSYVLGAGVNYTYDLQFNKNASWHVLPYVAVDYAHYKASDIRESGASALGLHANAMSANYADATLGVNFKRKDDDATYILGTAYRRALTGNDTDLRLYGNVADTGFTYTSAHEGRDGFILSAYADKRIGGNWSASASLENQWNRGGRNLSASVELQYMF